MTIKLYLLLFILFLNNYILKTNSQSTITLNALVYDNTPSRNSDFEPSGGGSVEKGLVQTNLGADGTPVYCCGNQRKGTIRSASTFNSWFHNVPGTNLPIQKNIVLTQSPTNPNLYTYSNSSFFIIDGEGFDNKALYPNEQQYYDNTGKARNFHFCLQAHTEFQYKTGDTFNFAGDDDVWVFINKKLVVDLGGLHSTAASSINLDTLGLTNGQNYPFDFFYCERHTTQSTIQITTSLKFVCPWYDACNVCQGDNSSCCLPSNCENNPVYIRGCIQARCVNNVCNVPLASCSSVTPCFDSVCNVGVGCQLVSKNCSSANNCWLDRCNVNSNACEHVEIPNCVNCAKTGCITDDLCKPKICNNNGDGCITTDKNCDDKNYCTTDTCSNGKCVHTPIDNCVNCPSIGCITTDLCSPLVCSADGASCQPNPLNCDDKNYCTNDTCSGGFCTSAPIENCVNCPSIGCITTDFCNVQVCDDSGTGCKTEPKNCTDGNYCTRDICNSPSGSCSFDIPDPKCVSCSSTSCTTTDGCNPQVCNASGDGCDSQPLTCDDGNPCTTDSCSNNGVCSHETIPNCVVCNSTFNCITTDLCKPNTCSGDSSSPTCVTNDYNCSDGNYCTNDTCSGNAVCSYTLIENCVQCATDIGCITTDKCSPQVCNANNDGCTTGSNGCDKGDLCVTTTCTSPAGTCVYTPIDCDDHDSCTIDSCASSNGSCLHETITNCQDCDNIGCITTDQCFPMVCSSNGTSCDKQTKSCDDGNPCTDDSCISPTGACQNTPISNCISCGDQKCVTTDLCKPLKCGLDGISCQEYPVNCDDGDGCTTDSCDSASATCSSTKIPDCVSCGNTSNCIITDYCKPKRCAGDASNPTCEEYDKDCSDNNFCTTDTCIGAGVCQYSSPDPLCVSCANTSCTTTDLCDPQICNDDGSGCISNPNKPCDDKNPCTNDKCNAGVCTHEIIQHCEVCSETLGCTTTEFCSPIVCSPDNSSCIKTERNCSDGNDCTYDFCHPELNICAHVADLDCILCGEKYCHLEDGCYPLLCVGDNGTECGNFTIDCNDNNPCTNDICIGGGCNYETIENCNICNTTFGCVGTSCFPSECTSTDNNATFSCAIVDKCHEDNNCTITKCDEEDGTCISVYIQYCEQCSTPGVFCQTIDPCKPIRCNAAGDGCDYIDADCNDHLFCTKDSCINGSCVNPRIDNCIECENEALMGLFSFVPAGKNIKSNKMMVLDNVEKIENTEEFGCINDDKCTMVSCVNLTSCEYTPIICDDSNPCSTDECQDGVCYHYPIGLDCQICTDVIGCPTNDTCIINECSPTLDSCISRPRDCSDGDDCTIDTCVSGQNCTHVRREECGGVAYTPPPNYCNDCEDDEICVWVNHKPVCVKNPVTTETSYGVTGHFTESGTTLGGGPYTIGGTNNPCQYIDCGRNLECYVINQKAECLPSNYRCMDCLDLECYLQDLSCMMIENPNYISSKSCEYDNSCCKFIPTCIPLGLGNTKALLQ